MEFRNIELLHFHDNISDWQDLQKFSNHPVHIVDEKGEFSPSAFIPFCEFGKNMSIFSQKIDQFDMPVCNSFKQIVLESQLRYELDLQDVQANVNDIGLILVLDLNRDRIVTSVDDHTRQMQKSLGNFYTFYSP